MIKPKGFFYDFLKGQMEGLTGHIKEAGYPFMQVQWGEPDFVTLEKHNNWWVYEQTAYHLDGFLKASILLDLKDNIKKVEDIVKKVYQNPDHDGYLGPRTLREGREVRWAHVVFFRMCIRLYDYNKDMDMIKAIERHYLESKFTWLPFRDQNHVEILCRLYEITNNKELLDLAIKMYKTLNEIDHPYNQITDSKVLKRGKLFCHGVTYNEFMKLGTILYMHTKDKYYLNISEKAFKKLNTYYMLPGGIHSSAEQTRSNYYMECYETCDLSDFTWASNYILLATKNHKYADAIENCIFNAGVGSVLEDFKGLQYFSCANQLILDYRSNHSPFSKGKQWMSYRPNPGTECCCANINRMMPNYIENMIHEENDNIYINLFGANQFENDYLIIEEDTKFPFSNSFKFNIKVKKPCKLYIRKIGYAKKLLIDGNYEENNDYFIYQLKEDTIINYSYEDEIKIIPCNRKGIYIKKGLFTYSYGEYGNREIDLNEAKSSKDFPAYNIYPDKLFGYEVKLNDINPVYTNGNPKIFSLKDDLPYIEINAYKIKNPEYRLQNKIIRSYIDLDGKKTIKVDKGEYIFTPDYLKGNYETENEHVRIKLYPYGACKLRETVFKVKK